MNPEMDTSTPLLVVLALVVIVGSVLAVWALDVQQKRRK
jgi:hypothetical protein